MDTKMKKEKVCDCPTCLEREQELEESEELNFAILVALVPALALSLFSAMGIF